MDESTALAGLLEREREVLLAEWRQKVRSLPSAAHLEAPTLNDHVPRLLDELAAALRRPNRALPALLSFQNDAAYEHGEQRVEDGYDISEVVAEYSMLRSCIHTLALIHGIALRDEQVNILNGVLDRAICVAVHAFAVNCELAEWQRRKEHLALVAHDLRAPLHAAALAVSMLDRQPCRTAGEEHRQLLDVLKRNVQQLSALVDAVIVDNDSNDLPGGLEQLRPRLLPLRALAEELIGSLRSTAELTGTPLVNEVPDAVRVYADAPMLRRVLRDLIANAFARCSSGPVRLGAQPLEGRLGVACWVSDEGTDPQQRSQSRSSQEERQPAAGGTPAREKRTALHLSIVKAFVKAHGGSLEIEPGARSGGGGTVRFRLPAAQRASD